MKQLTKNIVKITLTSLAMSTIGLLLYIHFRKTTPVIAIYGLILVFAGIITFAYLPEYIIYKKLTQKE